MQNFSLRTLDDFTTALPGSLLILPIEGSIEELLGNSVSKALDIAAELTKINDDDANFKIIEKTKLFTKELKRIFDTCSTLRGQAPKAKCKIKRVQPV